MDARLGAELPFRGLFNGVLFAAPGAATTASLGVPGCILEDASPEEIAGSPLNFVVADPDFRLGIMAASSCGGRLVSLGAQFSWRGRGGNVARFTGQPISITGAPIERLRAVDVGTKPGVIELDFAPAAHPVSAPVLAIRLVVVEDFGYTVIDMGGAAQDLIGLAQLIEAAQ